MPVLVAMVPRKATTKQTSQMKNNKKKLRQNSSSGSKLPKSKKELFDKGSFSFCLLNRSKWSEEHIIILDIDIDNIVESIWCISNIPNSEDNMVT